MAYFKTEYDPKSMTVSVDDEEVTRALGILGEKTPAALKVAVNTTARESRKMMLSEVKKRYDLNAKGRRMIEDLRQRQKATNRRPTAILAVMKNDPGAFRADLGYFRTVPSKPFMGSDVWNAPEYFKGRVLKGRSLRELKAGINGDHPGKSMSKGFLVRFNSGHIGMVQRAINEPADHPKGNRWKNKNGVVEKLYTMSSPSGSAMHHTVWEMNEPLVEKMLQDNTLKQIRKIELRAKQKGVI